MDQKLLLRNEYLVAENRIGKDVEELFVRMAKENGSRGYDWIAEAIWAQLLEPYHHSRSQSPSYTKRSDTPVQFHRPIHPVIARWVESSHFGPRRVLRRRKDHFGPLEVGQTLHLCTRHGR